MLHEVFQIFFDAISALFSVEFFDAFFFASHFHHRIITYTSLLLYVEKFEKMLIADVFMQKMEMLGGSRIFLCHATW
jgi:hypothetical protein